MSGFYPIQGRGSFPPPCAKCHCRATTRIVFRAHQPPRSSPSAGHRWIRLIFIIFHVLQWWVRTLSHFMVLAPCSHCVFLCSMTGHHRITDIALSGVKVSHGAGCEGRNQDETGISYNHDRRGADQVKSPSS